MCKFYSAILTVSGEVLHDIHTTSHEDLINLFGLNDDKAGRFCKLEYTSENLFDLSTYSLRADEDIKPEWVTDAMLEAAEKKLHQIVRKRIITEDRELLMGGIFVVAEDVKINNVRNAVIEVIRNSIVNVMQDNSTVNEMWGNSTVKEMQGNSTVNVMQGNSTVNVMQGNSTVNVMWGNSTVNVMWGNSTVNVMWGNSTVNVMQDNSTVNEMWGNSTVKNDQRLKK